MTGIVREAQRPSPERCPEGLLTQEWLVTNGLGGYASGTVSGVITRRYHGLLIADLPNLGRRMMLNNLYEEIFTPGHACARLGGDERSDCGPQTNEHYLKGFRLEMGLPVWSYGIDGVVIEKRIFFPYRQNTVHIDYSMVEGEGPVELRLRPAMNFRPHDDPVDTRLRKDYVLTVVDDRFEFTERSYLPKLRMLLYGQDHAFTYDRMIVEEVVYRTEESLGFTGRGDLWSPGYFHAVLSREQPATLVASTESWPLIGSLKPRQALAAEQERRRVLLSVAHAPDGLRGELVLAADQFVITPAGRTEDYARASAYGGEVRTVIAGYHWFTDWGRDTMISLEGLTLATGRYAEANWILRTFAHYVQHGLIPNRFPEGKASGVYNTADATLWFFHAIDRYLAHTGERALLRFVLPQLIDIVTHYREGTLFNIGIDAADGLVRQGDPSLPLTWMDAKVGDWVVTPRRGKAVEINALWYNALCLLAGWLEEEGDAEAAKPLRAEARECRESFNRRFWYEKGGYLYDVVDGEQGDDISFRPNQIFAVSPRHPVLEERRWKPVVDKVKERLVTPVGLRSLSRDSPDYKPKYYGDLRSRDAAYHQGTVWAWLIGPFIDAWCKVYGEEEDRTKLLEGFGSHLNEACIGSLSEIFDAEPPFTPRGCIAQAWSVAEVLRCMAGEKGGEGRAPAGGDEARAAREPRRKAESNVRK